VRLDLSHAVLHRGGVLSGGTCGENVCRPCARATAIVAAFLLGGALAPAARGAVGPIEFRRGTAKERLQVRAALAASAFPFGVVGMTITVHIKRDVTSQSQPGHVWLNSRLLDAGRFAWATVQDEFAHQVDFFVFDDAQRAALNALLGGVDWCYSVFGLPHSAYGCERFSSMVAWAYWPSVDNAYRPTSAMDESAAMPASRFRAVVDRMIAKHSNVVGGNG
jgi:hypothetical protein